MRLAFVEVSGGTPASMMPKSDLPHFPLDDEESDLAEPPPLPAEKPKPGTPPAAAKPAEEHENKKKFSKTYG